MTVVSLSDLDDARARGFESCLINENGDCLLINLLVTDVTPEYHAGPEDKIQCRGTLRVIHNRCHLVVVERDLADVVAAREEQRGVALHGLATRVIPRVPEVPVDTLAFERTLLVDTELRAGSWRLTLVNICNENTLIVALFLKIQLNIILPSRFFRPGGSDLS